MHNAITKLKNKNLTSGRVEAGVTGNAVRLLRVRHYVVEEPEYELWIVPIAPGTLARPSKISHDVSFISTPTLGVMMRTCHTHVMARKQTPER